MKIENIYKNLFIIKFDSKEELISGILRFSEYYESIKFKGKIFLIEDYIKWYYENYGEFNYDSINVGFNFPSSVFKPFYENKFQNISKEEQQILNYFKNFKKECYIISIIDNNYNTLKHEIAHYFWKYIKSYRDKINKVLNKIPKEKLKRITKNLKQQGYHPLLIKDEIHAYLTIDPDHPLIDIKISKQILNELKKIFEKYFKKIPKEKLLLNENQNNQSS